MFKVLKTLFSLRLMLKSFIGLYLLNVITFDI